MDENAVFFLYMHCIENIIEEEEHLAKLIGHSHIHSILDIERALSLYSGGERPLCHSNSMEGKSETRTSWLPTWQRRR